MNYLFGVKSFVTAGLLLPPFPATANDDFQLRLLGDISLFNESADLKEPSGLAMDPVTQRLWLVSDNAEDIFLLSLDGSLPDLGSLDVDTDDLEGISVRPDGSIVAVREKSNEILIIDRDNSSVIEETKLESISGYDQIKRDFEDGPSGKGLEGLTVDPATGVLYALKEGRPRLLLEISADLTAITDVQRLTDDIGFSHDEIPDKKLDVSGIAMDTDRGGFWIVSDAGKMIYFYDTRSGTAVGHALFRQKDGTRKPLKNAEGVALSRDGNILFIATDDDEESRLVSYEVLSPEP